MVEAQGRGILHRHFLLWIAGTTEKGFADKMFASLKGIMNCVLPGSMGLIPETSSDRARKVRMPHLKNTTAGNRDGSGVV
ncbi:hypothetical protein BDR07DRAFT_1420757 [Suillus spraguei]|nr:hypothetical protein BDR07DRAFT_1420757 [Suillus spraguei]